MLSQIAKHGELDLNVQVKGDLDVDEHHTIEDVAITLGSAIKQALGSKKEALSATDFYFRWTTV